MPNKVNLWTDGDVAQAVAQAVAVRQAALVARGEAGEQDMPWLRRIGEAADRLAWFLMLWQSLQGRPAGLSPGGEPQADDQGGR